MKQILIAVIVLFNLNNLSAQKIQVSEGKLVTSFGEMDAYEVWIPKCEEDKIEKSFEKWLKNHDGEVTNKKGEVSATKVVFKEFYQTPVNIYASLKESGNDVKLLGSIDAGAGFSSIKSQPELHQNFKNVIRNFAIAEAKEAALSRLNDEQKKLEKANNDLADLKKEKEHLQKDIDDCNLTIEKNKKLILTNDSDQTTKISEISGQDQKVKNLQGELDGIQ